MESWGNTVARKNAGAPLAVGKLSSFSVAQDPSFYMISLPVLEMKALLAENKPPAVIEHSDRNIARND
eukprot:5505337-Pleurochrysis_carterae.AAC.1